MKECPNCGKNNFSDENYCSNCGTKLEKSYSDSNNNDNLPKGYTYDWMGHQRPDPDYERERRRESQEAFKGRM